MRDRLTKGRRSWNMSRIRGKNTTPEKRVRSLLHRLGFRFRLHVRIPVSLSASNAPRPSDGRGIKGEGLRESEERFPRKVTSRVEPLNCSSRRESALLLPKRRWSGLTSAATRFMERAKVSCQTPRAVSVDILLPKIQNRHLYSRLLLASSSRLRELHDTNESAPVVADETRSQRANSCNPCLNELGFMNHET